jgi:ketosteroid isomerase-like protein
MKRMWAYSLVGLALLLGASGVQAAGANPSETAVAALEKAWMQAQQTNNYEALDPALADNFVQTGGNGKVTTTKAAALADAKTITWKNVDYSEMKFVVHGDTVIATGYFRGKGTDAEGKPVDERERFTDTWVKMADGKFQCVASQDTPVKK